MDETNNASETECRDSPFVAPPDSSNETKPLSGTQSWPPPPRDSSVLPKGHPSSIGRYRILGILGKGGFGQVYLAHDDDLDRSVAIKVPNRARIAKSEDVKKFLAEAKVLAKLDHPHIVPVFDVGRTDDGLCFVVSKLVDGSDLAVRMGQARISWEDSAEIVATIADALHYAHTRGLVHRDIKPANILIDPSGKPCVADFGLALKDEDFGKGGGLAGTPAYMSPEQARGEGHRVDGRSDIFSLGVVFYELLTARRPFRGDSVLEIIESIKTAEPRPLRQIDDTIPKELERICQKALSKRASDRYSTAKDMAEDLRLFLQTADGRVAPYSRAVPISTPPGSIPESAPATPTPTPTPGQSDSGQRPIKIIPKGLRSFDEQDADFFLELLPGPVDREGLPDSIRFWKRKIEQIDPDLTFSVGLIYGPSGCGKSSLVKAGLLPRLGQHVVPVYIEATLDDTEARLLRGLRKACPGLPRELGLVEWLATLRRGGILPPGCKVLIVLDQFEQWLFARRGEKDTELVAALRHCDGEHLQTIVMVRDDFWMGATRFMTDLEVRLLERENSAAVDLFDLDHARKVLVAFGLAFGKLPDNPSDTSSDQMSFLKQSVDGLAEEGKVISVRMALFAEMMKSKAWKPSTLKEVGGTKGVGVTFLEETFGASTAPPEHRLHQKAAQSVLKALLPAGGTDIKGQMIPRHELLEASGYAKRPRDFDDLIRILDSELRLITPTDPEVSSGDDESTLPSGQHYQLAHDYLVHSLRDWLTRKQRQTRRGRAELLLATAAQSWGANPRRQSLPTLTEWLSIVLLTRRDKWSTLERRMVHAAGSNNRARLVFALFVVALSCALPFFSMQFVRAQLLVATYAVTHDVAPCMYLIKEMNSLRFWVDPMLEARLAQAGRFKDADESIRYRAALAPTHPEARKDLYQVVLPTRRIYQDNIHYSLNNDQMLANEILIWCDSEYSAYLWEIATDTGHNISHRYFAASRLAVRDPSNSRWPDLASSIITDHDFAADPDLSFSQVGPYLEDKNLKAYFKERLLKKIKRSREMGCPGRLMRDLFEPKEAVTLVADGYLDGHFSLDSLNQNKEWFLNMRRQRAALSALHASFERESKDSDKEKRRQLALTWLRDLGVLSGQ